MSHKALGLSGNIAAFRLAIKALDSRVPRGRGLFRFRGAKMPSEPSKMRNKIVTVSEQAPGASSNCLQGNGYAKIARSLSARRRRKRSRPLREPRETRKAVRHSIRVARVKTTPARRVLTRQHPHIEAQSGLRWERLAGESCGAKSPMDVGLDLKLASDNVSADDVASEFGI